MIYDQGTHTLTLTHKPINQPKTANEIGWKVNEGSEIEIRKLPLLGLFFPSMYQETATHYLSATERTNKLGWALAWRSLADTPFLRLCDFVK